MPELAFPEPASRAWTPCIVGVASGIVALLLAPKLLAWQLARNVILGLGVVLVPLALILFTLPFFV